MLSLQQALPEYSLQRISRLSKTFRILRALDLVGFFARRLEPGESALTDNLDLV